MNHPNRNARIAVDAQGYVTLAYTDLTTGERVSRTFFCSPNGGYVREGDAQVCECLRSRGNTLRASSRADLPALIRREYRRFRRAESA